MFNVAILGSGKVDGSRAEPGERVVALCLLGSVNIDFATTPPPPEVSLLLINILGGANVWIQPTQEVKVSGFNLLGGANVDQEKPGQRDDFQSPLAVTSYSLLGGVNLKRRNGEASNDVG
jgi:hypothetical protein